MKPYGSLLFEVYYTNKGMFQSKKQFQAALSLCLPGLGLVINLLILGFVIFLYFGLYNYFGKFGSCNHFVFWAL